jgi:hypothetical protein
VVVPGGVLGLPRRPARSAVTGQIDDADSATLCQLVELRTEDEVVVGGGPAMMPWAWAERNWRQVGPDRCGAGSIPAACRISQTVDGAIG